MRTGRLFRDAVVLLTALIAVGIADTVVIWSANSVVAGRALSGSLARRPQSDVAQVIAPAPLPPLPSAASSANRPRPAPKHSSVRAPKRPAKRAPTVDAQRVSVTAPTSRATAAVVQRWVHRAGRWIRVGAAMRARVGAAGLTRHPSEKLAATPIGSFSLTQAFGALANTDNRITRLRYIHIRYGDTWGARPTRPTYNRYYNCHCRGATLFALRRTLFRYGMVIDYNRTPVVPGAGSGFFLHVANGQPTGGCVAVAAADVRMILSWLRPDLHPRILIRVARR
jgi:L,D-peptidoglycan transpeptidase YkuD (ErfK/YbiS/YcfS/YnhG family)